MNNYKTTLLYFKQLDKDRQEEKAWKIIDKIAIITSILLISLIFIR